MNPFPFLARNQPQKILRRGKILFLFSLNKNVSYTVSDIVHQIDKRFASRLSDFSLCVFLLLHEQMLSFHLTQ